MIRSLPWIFPLLLLLIPCTLSAQKNRNNNAVFAKFQDRSNESGGLFSKLISQEIRQSDNGVPTVSMAPRSVLGHMEVCSPNIVFLPVRTTGFTEVGAYNLTIKFNPDKIQLITVENTAGFPLFEFSGSSPDEILIAGQAEESGFTLPDSTILFTLQFYYQGDSVPLLWFPWSDSCRYYTFPDFAPMLQEPLTSFYYDGAIIERQVKDVSVTIASGQPSCCEDSSLFFTALPVNGGMNPQFQWKINGNAVPGAVQPSFTYFPQGGEMVAVELLSSETCTRGNPATSDAIEAIVIPSRPVSLTISVDQDTICDGTLVHFSAISVNGGTMPQFQWFKNGTIISGATSQQYEYSPSDGDMITCQLTSNEICAKGNPATSQSIRIKVNPIRQVTATLQPETPEVCSGTPVTFTATITNGGNNPVYQWFVNNIPVTAAMLPMFTYTPQDGDNVHCEVTSSEGCPGDNPVLTDLSLVKVNPNLPVSVAVTPGSSFVCQGSPVTYRATVVNGGTAPVYTWKINNVVSGTNSPHLTYIPSAGDVITCAVNSNITCPVGNPATSPPSGIQVFPLKPVSVNVTASANQVCDGTKVTFSAFAVNGGANPIYQWRKNGMAVGSNSPVLTITPANNDQITCTVTSVEPCNTGSPAISNTLSMVVFPKLQVGITVNSSVTTLCDGTTVNLTTSVTNGGANPQYQWRINGNNIPGATSMQYQFIPQHGDSLSCLLTSSETCTQRNPVFSNRINYSVHPNLPVSIQIVASETEVCAGTPVSLTATPVNGGSVPQFQWFIDGLPVSGAVNPSYTFTPVNGDSITCRVVSNVDCPVGNPAISNVIPLKVNPNKPVSVQITSSSNPSCQGNSVTLKAKPVNGGSSPVFLWKVNNQMVGSNSSQYSYVPVNNDLVTCTVLSNVLCPTGNPATSEPLNLSVLPLAPVSVSVVASATEVCNGTKVVFTAFPLNGGSSPVYQWKKNGVPVGGNQPVYECYPQNNDVITCTLSSNMPCKTGSPAISSPVSITVRPLLTVGITISTSTPSVCSGSRADFSATPVNGGSFPAFQWFVNGTNVSGATAGTYNYTPQTGDQVTCRLNSSETCVLENPVLSAPLSVTVNPLMPVSLTVTPSANGICHGTAVQYNATPVNGGTMPAYEWKVNGQPVSSASGTQFTYIPVNNDVVTCKLTSNITCATSNPSNSAPVTMVVNPLLPVSATITASAATVCAGTQVTMTTSLVNGGTNPQYQWKKNGVPVSGATSSAFVFTPSDKDSVRCIITSNAVCATGNPATSNNSILNVNPLLPVSITTTASFTTVCAGTSVQYIATAVNPGPSPVYQWQVNGVNVSGATGTSYAYVPSNNDNVKCKITSNATCATGSPAISQPVLMTVNPLLPVSVTLASSAAQVCAGTVVNFTATPVNGGNFPSYIWKKNGTVISGASGSTYGYSPENADQISCTLTSTATCATGSPANSNLLSTTVNPLLPVSISVAASANPVCAGTSVSYTATTVNQGSAPAYQWYRNGTAVSGMTGTTYSLVPSNNDVIMCKVTSSEVCATGNPSTSNNLSMTVNPLLPVSITVSTPATTICSGVSAVFTATPVNGGTTPAYQWVKNGVNVSGATGVTYTYAPANNDNIKCLLTSNATCATGSPATSNTQAMTVNPLIPVTSSVTATAYAVMPNTSVTFTASSVNGGSSPTYQWKVNNVVVGTNSPTYSYTPANNDNVKCVVTSSLTGCLSGNPANSPVVNMVVYSSGTPCTGLATVTHGGLVYNTVQVGTQCWLRENINMGTKVIATATQTNNNIVEKYCYVDDEYYCNFYGGLYQWAEMVQYYNGVTNITHWSPVPTTPVQGICPPGWHIPTNAEATTMINYFGGQTVAGGKMKESGYAHWNSPNTSASNQAGFTALPGGNNYSGTFTNLRQYATFWTITMGPAASDAKVFGAPYNFGQSLAGDSKKTTGYSVRCLKN
jgi:uncharacterized protein (TIGR02145 family)